MQPASYSIGLHANPDQIITVEAIQSLFAADSHASILRRQAASKSIPPISVPASPDKSQRTAVLPPVSFRPLPTATAIQPLIRGSPADAPVARSTAACASHLRSLRQPA